MLAKIFQPFIEESAVSVMVRGLVERLLNPQQLDEWFEKTAESQYTRELMFSSVFGMMTEVVCGVRSSLNQAYAAHQDELPVSITSVYNKVNGIEGQTSADLVRYSGQQAQALIEELGAERASLLPGYRVRILDGTCLAASEKRLEVLRGESAAALPGKAVVVYDPAFGLVTDMFPCEDGHAQERRLLPEVLERVKPGEVWIGDRNFCTRGFLLGLEQRGAYFIIREHKGLPWVALDAARPCGRTETGTVSEHRIAVTDEQDQQHTWRRVCVELDQPTRDGDPDIHILTNLPAEPPKKDIDSTRPSDAEPIDACQVAEAYRQRWGIETAFQHITQNFNAEITTLGYPRAALFGLSVGLVAYNVFAVVLGALRSAHPEKDLDSTLSSYALAGELRCTYRGMMIAIPSPQWRCFQTCSLTEAATVIRELAGQIRLSAFLKKRRGPKKPTVKRPYNSKRPHVSTAKQLAAAAARKSSP